MTPGRYVVREGRAKGRGRYLRELTSGVRLWEERVRLCGVWYCACEGDLRVLRQDAKAIGGRAVRLVKRKKRAW